MKNVKVIIVISCVILLSACASKNNFKDSDHYETKQDETNIEKITTEGESEIETQSQSETFYEETVSESETQLVTESETTIETENEEGYIVKQVNISSSYDTIREDGVFSYKDFEEYFCSKLDPDRFGAELWINTKYNFYQLNIFEKDIDRGEIDNVNICFDVSSDDEITNYADFYIKYGLEEDVFTELVFNFIKTIKPNLSEDELNDLTNKFKEAYMSESENIVGTTNSEYGFVLKQKEAPSKAEDGSTIGVPVGVLISGGYYK